ncbi:26S proteasome non-ATPase regulatory subunit 12 [Homalodisca vitripennis]|nr:26S proteasome non-ATPase regulatory subunit 12 [Homalodisca vitripennis]
MADTGGLGIEGGRIVKMEVDYSATCDEKIPECKKMAQEGKMHDALDALLALEKQTRTTKPYPTNIGNTSHSKRRKAGSRGAEGRAAASRYQRPTSAPPDRQTLLSPTADARRSDTEDTKEMLRLFSFLKQK